MRGERQKRRKREKEEEKEKGRERGRREKERKRKRGREEREGKGREGVGEGAGKNGREGGREKERENTLPHLIRVQFNKLVLTEDSVHKRFECLMEVRQGSNLNQQPKHSQQQLSPPTTGQSG